MTQPLGQFLVNGSKTELAPLMIDTDRLIGTGAGVVANAGAGKSGLIRRMAEITYGQAQHIFLDAEDEFYTLREKFDYVIFGGENGDCPITVKGAADLAIAILTHGMSAIIQLNDLHAWEQEQFVANFIGAMMEAPRALWHPALVFQDEAHRFVPQDGEAASSEALKDLVSRGRKRGFTPILATQRMAKIDKNATDSINNWFIGRVGQSTDRRTASDHLGFSPSSSEGRGLQALENRTFWGFGPAVSRVPIQFVVEETETTIIPAGGAAVPTPPAPAAMQELLRSLAEAAKAAEVPEVPPEGAADTAVACTHDVDAIREEGFRSGFKQGMRTAIKEGRGHHAELLRKYDVDWSEEERAAMLTPASSETAGAAQEITGTITTEGSVRLKPESWQDMERMPTLGKTKTVLLSSDAKATPPADPGGMSRSTQAILKALQDMWPRAVPFLVAAKHAGVGLKSSQFHRYEPELKASGQVDIVDGKYRAKMSAPTGVDLLNVYAGKMQPSWWSIVQVVRGSGKPMTRDEIITAAGISPTSSTGGAALKALVDDFEVFEKTHDNRYLLAEAFR